MERERIKLIIRNMELLLESLKKEVGLEEKNISEYYDDEDVYGEK